MRPLSEFDPDWPHGHVTRNGFKARIICNDAEGSLPIVALVVSDNETEIPYMYTTCGMAWKGVGNSGRDLFNVPEPKKSGVVWINVYKTDLYGVYKSKETADKFSKRLACVKVEWTEGDGLNEH